MSSGLTAPIEPYKRVNLGNFRTRKPALKNLHLKRMMSCGDEMDLLVILPVSRKPRDSEPFREHYHTLHHHYPIKI